ncbi:MAG: hypothetical protein ABW250_17440 [Pyrinomonadaceae bacterium]
MPESNIYEELKQHLTEFKSFLDTNVPVIKPAIVALRSVVPQITELLNKLIELMGKLKTEIQNLNVNAIPNLDKVSDFTNGVKALLEASKNLLPNEAGAIDDVLGVVNVVSGLPSLDAIKADITGLIDAIVVHLNSLKS